jgi:hypothetical protein
MTKLIIYAVIVAIIFFTRNYWAPFIVGMFKRKTTTVILNEKQKSIFVPIGTVRTFYIAIEITEQPDGSASFDIKKLKTEL